MTRLVALLVVLSAPAVVRGHSLDPALLELVGQADGHYDVTWRTALYRARGVHVDPVLPAHCRVLQAPVATEAAESVTVRWRVDCGARGLVGEAVGVTGLGTARTDALVRITLPDGRLVRGVVHTGAPLLTVPERPSRWAVLHDFGRMGVAHILTGADHLAFVFGLVLLVAGAGQLLTTVTAFTLGHSLTLSAATLDLVRVPARPTELLIALTVLALAVELSGPASRPTLLRRWPWAMAIAFGLLHGLGFAGALREVGVPTGDVPLALLAFNGGVEIGQLAFIAAVLLAIPLIHRLRLPAWSRWVPVYVMGSLAALWCFERAAGLGS